MAGHVLTAEDRTRSRLVRAEMTAPKPHLITKFGKEALWAKLASEYGIPLPGYGVEITDTRIRVFLNRIGMTVPQFKAWAGWDEEGIGEWARQNPRWPRRGLCGLLLEEVILDPGGLGCYHLVRPGIASGSKSDGDLNQHGPNLHAVENGARIGVVT